MIWVTADGPDSLTSYARELDLIGNTPLVRLNRIPGPEASEVVVKIEAFNPGGSVKDRIGLRIVEDAEAKGQLKPGGTIVEATSGNTGAGLALAAIQKGYRAIFVMPDKMSQEKTRYLKALGAQVVSCPTAVEPEDPRSYYSVSRRIAEETPNAILANQFIFAPAGSRANPAVIGAGTSSSGSGMRASCMWNAAISKTHR